MPTPSSSYWYQRYLPRRVFFPGDYRLPVSAISFLDLRQLALGIGCLFVGVLTYVIARPTGAMFLPEVVNLGHHVPGSLVSLTGSIPVFFHVLGLSLLTASVLAPSKKVTVVICLGWAVINSLFELGQHAAIYAWLTARLSVELQDIWFFEQTLHYFHHGTFDPADLVSSLLTAGIAYLVIRHTTKLRGGRS